MGWFDGVVQCAPLSATCVLDWDAISAVATAAAVYFAWHAIRSENEHRNTERNRADQAQREELARMAGERKSLARRLAKIFHREVYEGLAEMVALIHVTEAVRTQVDLEQYIKVYAQPLNPRVFAMHERFLGSLDVFPDQLAIALVNNMTNWKAMPYISDGFPNMPAGEFFRKAQPRIIAQAREVCELHRETMTMLEPFFADLPGITPITPEEVRALNDAAAAKAVSDLAARDAGNG
ncbi:hypothetical protein OCJ37_19765 [Xanthomonas sp. AM6]|uniref:hypothetical protein n=1 Tax=Xanthomonas sp. AM6 TaxID=2982531 RepID=UPI0021D7F0A6|nr:hypothetical protein [Xanthomonas sp. AM6]UYB52171.1 hypothetical protein OCJ37_19765 [Xanthomonas sp. AM6]